MPCHCLQQSKRALEAVGISMAPVVITIVFARLCLVHPYASKVASDSDGGATNLERVGDACLSNTRRQEHDQVD